MTKRGGIPPVPNRNPQERQFLEAMKEAIEIAKGHRGNPLDRYISMRDLIDAGIATLKGKATNGYVSGSALDPTGAGPGNGSGPGNQPPADLTVPNAPTGLSASKGLGMIYLTWDAAAYSNHAHTNIYRHSEDNFANAVVITNTIGRMYADPVPFQPMDEAAESTRGYYYWITFVSEAGVESPPNSLAGTYQEPEVEPEYLLNRLSSLINASHLHSDLTSRIDLIDGPDSLPGSVAARMKEEVRLREESNSAVAASVNQLATKVNNDVAAVEQKLESFDGIRSQWTIKTEVGGRVAGVGLMNDGNTSSFEILASNFAVLDPDNPSQVVMGTMGGRTVIDGAYIRDATITTAAIRELSVNKLTGNIGEFLVANITDATIGIGKLENVLRSTNYSSNSGWAIHKSGLAIFNDAHIRGTMKSSNYSPYRSGWELRSDGGFTLRGSGGKVIMTTAGVPASSVSGLGNMATRDSVAAHDVNGLGSLATRNKIDNSAYIANAVVDTLQLAGQAVTITSQRYGDSNQPFDVNSNPKWVSIVGPMSVHCTGAPVLIYASLTFNFPLARYLSEGVNGFMRLRREHKGKNFPIWDVGDIYFYRDKKSVCVMVGHSPSPGDNKFFLEVKGDFHDGSTQKAYASHRVLGVHETKR